MKSKEEHISYESEYYVCLASAAAKQAFFYPACVGKFIYEAGYKLYRQSFDSYLLMYISSGKLTVEYDDQKIDVSEGEFVLLDCYKKHAYYSEFGWESIWCHFDGPVAKQYYEIIVEKYGYVFRMINPYSIISKMQVIFNSCASGVNTKEALLSKLITDILTAIIIAEDMTSYNTNRSDSTEVINEVITYINEKFTENISVSELADKAMLSQYYFIRLFKKSTGYTPHEYIINLRLNAAKYLLKSSQSSIKEICFSTGFSCESAFCSTFKKATGLSPAQYRKSGS